MIIDISENFQYFLKKKQIKLFFIIIYININIVFFFIKEKSNKNYKESKLNNKEKLDIYLDKYEINIYNNIRKKLSDSECSRMWDNHCEFLNGVIRKFRPKKIIELGVAEGGSSIVILNAIQDIENSHLYSIDLSSNEMIGFCVKNIFPELSKKWSLYKGNIAAKFLERIGKGIDMAMIDTSHFEPGEILDFLIIIFQAINRTIYITYFI